jgi:hypothetical protein
MRRWPRRRAPEWKKAGCGSSARPRRVIESTLTDVLEGFAPAQPAQLRLVLAHVARDLLRVRPRVLTQRPASTRNSEPLGSVELVGCRCVERLNLWLSCCWQGAAQSPPVQVMS